MRWHRGPHGGRRIMISADDYIVQVQDFDELLEYRYNDYAKARHLMDVEALPVGLLPGDRRAGTAGEQDDKMALLR